MNNVRVDVCGIGPYERVPLTRGQVEAVIEAVANELDASSTSHNDGVLVVRVLIGDKQVAVYAEKQRTLYRSELIFRVDE